MMDKCIIKISNNIPDPRGFWKLFFPCKNKNNNNVDKESAILRIHCKCQLSISDACQQHDEEKKIAEIKFCCHLWRLCSFLSPHLQRCHLNMFPTPIHSYAQNITLPRFTILHSVSQLHLPHWNHSSYVLSQSHACWWGFERIVERGWWSWEWFDLQVFPREHKDLSTGR